MRRLRILVLILIVAFIGIFLARPAQAHEDHDTRERLEEAGFTPAQVDIIAEHFDELDALQGGESHAHSESGEFWDELTHIVSDPAHWVAEIAAEASFFVLEVLIISRLVHWHSRRDRHFHPEVNDD